MPNQEINPMADFLSRLRALLTGEKPAPPKAKPRPAAAQPVPSDSKLDQTVIQVFNKFFYAYRDSGDKLVTHVDKAMSVHQGKTVDAYLVALELAHKPGVVIWVTASPNNYMLMLLYGDDAPDYEGYMLGLKAAYFEQDIPSEPRALWDVLQNLVTNGYLDQKLTYTGKVDPKQQ
jgi:hypothetical protein